MVKIAMKQAEWLAPLQPVASVIEKRQTRPILSHVLLQVKNDTLTLIGTDTDVELHSIVKLPDNSCDGLNITVPGKKFLDICKSLPEDNIIELVENSGKVHLSCGRSRFIMPSFSGKEFPLASSQKVVMSFSIDQKSLAELIKKTSFAIPQQDIRQYLNGLLFEVKDGAVRTLATDGHRLAVDRIKLAKADSSFAQVIIPRKAIIELSKLLNTEGHVSLGFNDNVVQISGDNFLLISKLINGKFPNYNKIIPKKGDFNIEINCSYLKQALMRVGILSNELFRSVHFGLRQNTLTLDANNPEQEEAFEELSVEYEGEELNIVFNVGYFVDILNAIDSENVKISFKNNDSGVVIEESGSSSDCLYVLMPIRQ